MKEKFIGDLDIIEIPGCPSVYMVSNFLIDKSVLSLFYGIRLKRYFEYVRDNKRMGWIVRYN